MKLTAIFILVAFMQVSAEGFSQNVTLNETNASLDKVFTEIRKQTGYDFLYSTRLLRNTVPVTIKTKNSSLGDVLAVVFKNQPLTYSITENTIVLKRKDERFMEEVSKFTIIQPDAGTIALGETMGVVSNYTIPGQRVDVRGKVVDAKGDPLIGVSVRVKGSQIGASTDVQGNFVLDAPANAVLVFTYIGYVTQEVAVNGRTAVNITLVDDSQALSEVVVTALGVTKEKRALVYSVQEVRGEEFTQARDNNIASSLTGKIAGVDATQINAGPGGSSRVVIRGNNSLSNAGGSGPNQQPLYVVNGLPINNTNSGANQNTTGINVDRGDGISMINPDDIATISVLKGGAAAALYGSQAANGVILITTKSGKSQKGIGVEFNSVANVGTPSVYPNYQYEYGQGQFGVKPKTVQEAIASGRLSFGPKMDGTDYIQVDGKMHPYSPVTVKENIKSFYRPSTDLTNTLAFNTGGQSFNARLSVSDLRSQSQQLNSTFQRQTATLGLNAKMGKNDFITIKSDLQYNIVTGKNRPTVGYAEYNANWPAYLLANTVDIRSLAPGYDPVTGKELAWNPAPEAPNPWFIVDRMGNSDKTQRYIASASVQVNLLKNLYVMAQGQRDFQNRDLMDYVPIGKNSQPFGNLNTGNRQDQVTNIQSTLNYNTSFLNNFNVTSFIGANHERRIGFGNNINGRDFVIPDFISLTNLSTITTTASGTNPYRTESSSGTNSLFGSADFDFKRVVYLSVTGRQDWFSVLNPGSNSIFYPSIGTGVILSDIIKMPAKVDFLKLRGSWAQVGSATVGAGTVNQTYSINTVNGYNVPTQGVSTTLQNPDLRPLTVTTIEGGFDAKLFNNILGLDLTYYSKVTTNDIVGINISQTSGFTGGNVNVGKTTNKGIEAMLTASPISNADGFSWSTNLNYSYNQSKIVELAPTVAELSLGNGIQGGRIVNRVGLPYATLMVFQPKLTAAGVPIYNKTSNFPEAEEVAFGVANPPHMLGFSNTFKYKNLSLDVLLDGKFGAVGYSNLMFYATRFGLNPQTLPGRETGLPLTGVDQFGAPYNYTWTPSTIQNYYNQLGRGYSALWSYNTDFVKLRRFVLNYNIPVSKLNLGGKIQAASVALVANNLAILYRDKRVKEAGLDPEFQESTSNAQGTGGVQEPKTRVIGLNLMVKF